MTLLLDLADAARSSGLTVIELPDWRTNISAGGFEPVGVTVHHTGSFDALADPANDLDYAHWLAFKGRPPTVPPPLCNLALSAEGVVYVCCSGNANHAGQARASGPMPAAADGNVIYIGIEAMNSGSQGWTELQYDAYVALCAALCRWYGWPASHVRAHREISVTGKVDPSGATPHGPTFDMDLFRSHVAARITHPDPQEDDMPYTDWPDEDRKALVADILNADVGGERTVKAALRMASKAPALARDLDRTIEAVALRLTNGAETATVDRSAIVEALKIALREGTD